MPDKISPDDFASALRTIWDSGRAYKDYFVPVAEVQREMIGREPTDGERKSFGIQVCKALGTKELASTKKVDGRPIKVYEAFDGKGGFSPRFAELLGGTTPTPMDEVDSGVDKDALREAADRAAALTPKPTPPARKTRTVATRATTPEPAAEAVPAANGYKAGRYSRNFRIREAKRAARSSDAETIKVSDLVEALAGQEYITTADLTRAVARLLG